MVGGICLHIVAQLLIYDAYYTGESGLVYKAYLDTAVGKEIVAVKTVKGVKNVIKILICFYVHYP